MPSKNPLHLAFNACAFWNSVCWLIPKLLPPNERYCLTVSQECEVFHVCLLSLHSNFSSVSYWPAAIFIHFLSLCCTSSLFFILHSIVRFSHSLCCPWKWEFDLSRNKGMVHDELLNSEYLNHTACFRLHI